MPLAYFIAFVRQSYIALLCFHHPVTTVDDPPLLCLNVRPSNTAPNNIEGELVETHGRCTKKAAGVALLAVYR